MNNFRQISQEAFGIKPIVRIRDIDAVVNNYLIYKKRAEATNSICAVVLKADVHGLGIKEVSLALYNEGARYFFIAELHEGVELRNILPQNDARIYALAGLLESEEEYFHKYNITPCLNSLQQLKRWNNYCQNNGKRSAVIHLDTHMNRLGLLDSEVEELSKNYDKLTLNLEIDFYMSHFFDIKGDDHTNCFKQLEILKQFLEVLPSNKVSFACTDSVTLLDNTIFNYDIIRPGIGLVGGAPSADKLISQKIKNTFEIYAKISQFKNIKKGDTIGYGGAYTAKRDTRIAVAQIGYKDGYMRLLSETDIDPKGVYMFLDGYRLSILGKISLDATVIDITDVPEEILTKTKYVEVVGPNVDIKHLADVSGCYEIMVSLGRINNKVNDYTLTDFNNKFKS